MHHFKLLGMFRGFPTLSFFKYGFANIEDYPWISEPVETQLPNLSNIGNVTEHYYKENVSNKDIKIYWVKTELSLNDQQNQDWADFDIAIHAGFLHDMMPGFKFNSLSNSSKQLTEIFKTSIAQLQPLESLRVITTKRKEGLDIKREPT